MRRIIKDQILAGTGPDLDGPGLDRETILNLFDQLRLGFPSGVRHDLTQIPTVRILACRLDDLPSGELVIRADLEVLDEDRFRSIAGGFSIAFTGLTRRCGSSDPALKVLVNPRQFDFSEVCGAVFEAASSDVTIDVTERIEKAAVSEIAIIVMVLGLGQVMKGFLSAAGAEIYRKLRCLRRRDDPDAAKKIHLDLVVRTRETPVRYIRDVDGDVTERDIAALDLTILPALLPAGIPPSRIDRVAGRIFCRTQA